MDTWIERREVINSSRNVIHTTVINSIIVQLQNIDTSNREVDARRQELEGRLADFGVPVDSYPDDYQRYVHHRIGNIDDVVVTILQQHESVRAKEDRRRAVVAKLKAIKLKLRQDSRLCQAYIDDGTGNVDEIVVVMKEWAWYFRCTIYASNHARRYADIRKGKRTALQR